MSYTNLPPALTEEENANLLRKVREGKTEEERLTTRNAVVEGNLRLVVYVARKFENTGIDLADRMSIATIGAIKAVNTFNLDKEVKFATYASRCMENEILMYLRKNSRKQAATVSLDMSLNVDFDGNELTLSDVLDSGEDEYAKRTDSEGFRAALQEFQRIASPRDMAILHMRFEEDKTQKEVAEELDISQSYISRLEKRVLNKLRKVAVEADIADAPQASIKKPANKGEVKDMAVVDKQKLKWFFTNAAGLSNLQIAEIMDCTSITVGKWRHKFDQGKMKGISTDDSTERDFQKWLEAQPPEKRKLIVTRIQRRREDARTAPSEVKVSFIAPAAKAPETGAQGQGWVNSPDAIAMETDNGQSPSPQDELQKAFQQVASTTNEVGMSVVLHGADVDRISDFMEVFMQQLDRTKTYRFHVNAYEA